MLAERERERREAQRLVSMGRQPSKTDLRPKSAMTDDSDRDLPSYMRSTSASVKKEKLVMSPPERVRRRSSSGYTQSQGDLRMGGREEESSSEEDGRAKRRSGSMDRRAGRESPGRGIAGRAKSERDLSRVAKVKVAGQVRAEGPMQPQQMGRPRTKLKTTTIISTGSDGAMVVSQPPERTERMERPERTPQYSVKGTEAVDVTRAPLSRQLAQVGVTPSSPSVRAHPGIINVHQLTPTFHPLPYQSINLSLCPFYPVVHPT